jgi:hypothetical protein
MHQRLLVVFSAVVALAFSAATTQAGENVWSGLVIANNAPQPEPTPRELARIQGTLKALFGYNQFKLIGQSNAKLEKGYADWTATSKYFTLHVDSKGARDSGYLLALQLFQEKKLLLETEAKLNKQSPLVIKGPQVGDGQLLLLLSIQ